MPRVPSRFLLPALVGLAACESTEPMSHPFQAVPAPTASVVASTPEDAGEDARFAAFDEPFTMSSEDMVDGGATDSADDAPVTAPVADGGTQAPAAPAPPQAAAPTAPVVQPTATMPAMVQAPAAPLGWAIRLVTTVPNAQPPRAILGLPGGDEVVVTPGAMVPDAGLVVLSIGPDSVQLARVQASGDHADVEAFTLAPQYR